MVYLIKAMKLKKHNMDKHEESHEKFMYLKYNLDSFQNESTQYLYKNRLDEKLSAKQESELNEIYGSIMQSLHEITIEVQGEIQKTKPQNVVDR
jgi:hypothetical protein